MDPFNYCIQCNPQKNWMELEFRSENDEPIDGLDVTITLDSTGHTYSAKTNSGKVVFGNIPSGEYRASVSQSSLLTEVEKYASRKDGDDSPVKLRAEKEKDGAGENTKEYHLVTIGDFWDEAPKDDPFLIEHHQGIDINASQDKPGFRLYSNHTFVFEIKALRSYLPYIVDTDEFSLVNSYTFALLARLAYATDKKDLDKGSMISEQGSIQHVIEQLKKREIPTFTADIQANWLVEEVPYSQALSSQYYAYKEVGAEGYLLHNEDIVILGVRGTEPYFTNGEAFNDNENVMWQVVKDSRGFEAIVNPALIKAAVGTLNVVGSSGFKDLVETDLDAAQIPIEIFGNTYVHQGFYRYTMTLWNGTEKQSLERDIGSYHQGKSFYVCGHSLGGAGATIMSALLKENNYASGLRLYTYGSPRTGTRSFVERYQSIVHHRHVNDHDLVPQIPMRWLNTEDAVERVYTTVKALIFGCLGQFVTSSGDILKDQDDDNYHHHGQLTQLLTYAPDQQVLLTPRQTHIPILDAIKMTDADSYQLLENIDANVAIAEQVAEHGMDAYIPNFTRLLKMLLDVSLKEHYSSVLNYLPNLIRQTDERCKATKMEHANMAGDWHYSEVNKARYWYLEKQITVTENMLLALERIRVELEAITRNPELMPTDKLLVANQALPESIKDQICQL
ncbi:lipase [Vibrio parahaemolyticus]|uniref:lipase family protein n=1 Tax=Vibrio parahaemolyticus TaxID=670 RepID=UPI00186AAD47|nr:lipase [Vibrio parahaemolyticus]MBE3793484.1 lipase [Vibrio parahaemolyticus]MCC3796858.1 lipase [Vibrio parahaemolyticus]MCC3811664.1 lipase [Vibrio parahaemolyticus]MCR9727941.1 lipase [Vibrio parahaemolyticus]MCR9750360.1 lipase [Vibrio parahaemolyticus]